jgi:hypothetical protein
MALITVDAVVNVTRHVVVIEVGRIVAAMAAGALEYRVIIRVGVAGRANVVGIAVTGWELRVLRVIERRTGPGTRVVAVLARCREELRLRCMAGICAGVVIRLMAADTLRRQSRVIAVYVAI